MLSVTLIPHQLFLIFEFDKVFLVCNLHTTNICLWLSNHQLIHEYKLRVLLSCEVVANYWVWAWNSINDIKIIMVLSKLLTNNFEVFCRNFCVKGRRICWHFTSVFPRCGWLHMRKGHLALVRCRSLKNFIIIFISVENNCSNFWNQDAKLWQFAVTYTMSQGNVNRSQLSLDLLTSTLIPFTANVFIDGFSFGVTR